VLATDGFIVYDIQDEKGRVDADRPFPFRKTLDPSWYGSLFPQVAGKQCIVYKSVVEESVDNFNEWLDVSIKTHKNKAFNLVGAPTSKLEYKGPSLPEAASIVRSRGDSAFGCVCIAERHGTKRDEASAMCAKADWGAQWFISQGVYSAAPMIKLLNDYGDMCKARGVVPKKVIITFAPCGRAKTMTFIKWLGMAVPEEAEQRILTAESPVRESIQLLCEILQSILESTSGSGVPIGINVESLSIFKEEIDGAHTLFQRLQALLLNHRGSPWAVRWFLVHEVRPSASYENITQLAPPYPKKEEKKKSEQPLVSSNQNRIAQRDDLALERTLMLGTSLLSAISTVLFIYNTMSKK